MAGFDLKGKKLLMEFKVNATGNGLEDNVKVLTKNNTDPFIVGDLDKMLSQGGALVKDIASDLVNRDPEKRKQYIANSGSSGAAAPKSKISELTVADDFLENTTTDVIELVAAATGPPAMAAMVIPTGEKFKITLTTPNASDVTTGENQYKITYDSNTRGVELDIKQADLIAKFDGKTTHAAVYTAGKRARRKSSKRKSAKHKRGGRRGRRKSNKRRR